MRNKQADLIKKLSDKELVLNLYFTQCILLLITFILSRLIRGDWFFVFRYFEWNGHHFWLGIIFALVVVIMEIIFVKLVPKDWFDDGGINERMFHKRAPLHIIWISFIVGVSEELLFRGFLQTTFGLIPSAIIFALIHFRYLHHFFLFFITVGLSLSLGLLYMYTGNLLSVIIAHMFIDMILGLFIRFQLMEKIKAD